MPVGARLMLLTLGCLHQDLLDERVALALILTFYQDLLDELGAPELPEECPICLDALGDSPDGTHITMCDHRFHTTR